MKKKSGYIDLFNKGGATPGQERNKVTLAWAFALLFLACLMTYCSGKRTRSDNAGKSTPHNAFALMIGVEYFDVDAYRTLGLRYNYNNAATAGVRTDMKHFKSILMSTGVSGGNITELLTGSATVENIKDQLKQIGSKLIKDDTFIFYFSGHGDSVKNSDSDEREEFDQFLVTYNNRFLDDDLHRSLISFFKPGVNFIMVIDACHSGSSYELEGHCDLNQERIKNYPLKIIYLGATADNDEAAGSSSGSLFTDLLHRTYFDLVDDDDLNKFSYEKYLKKVQSKLSCGQSVQFKVLGDVDSSMLIKPFKIN